MAAYGEDVGLLELVDMEGLAREIAELMCGAYPVDERIGDASPARKLFAEIAYGEAAAPLIEASKEDGDARVMAMTFASGSAAGQFALLAEALRDVFGIEAARLVAAHAVPELSPAPHM